MSSEGPLCGPGEPRRPRQRLTPGRAKTFIAPAAHGTADRDPLISGGRGRGGSLLRDFSFRLSAFQLSLLAPGAMLRGASSKHAIAHPARAACFIAPRMKHGTPGPRISAFSFPHFSFQLSPFQLSLLLPLSPGSAAAGCRGSSHRSRVAVRSPRASPGSLPAGRGCGRFRQS